MLSKKIEQVRERYYDKKYSEEYLKKSSIKIKLPESVIKFSRDQNIIIKEINNGVFPSSEWYIHFPKFETDSFKAKYTTHLTISRLIKVYSVLNSFDVDFVDPDRIEPKLSGDSEEGFTKLQFKFLEVLNNSLEEEDYDYLPEDEGFKIVEGIKFNDKVSFFGPKVAVDDLLYRDVWLQLPEE